MKKILAVVVLSAFISTTFSPPPAHAMFGMCKMFGKTCDKKFGGGKKDPMDWTPSRD